MTVLADHEIATLAKTEAPIISPYFERLHRTDFRGAGILSYGQSSYGYDVRLAAAELKVFTNLNGGVIDPRKMEPSVYTTPINHLDQDGSVYVILPPNSILLGHTVETFAIPDDVLGICQGKSTYARAGVSLIVTPLEPGWKGQLVLEIVNHTSSPVRIYPIQGIAQITFFRGSPCQTSYATRGGKYQGQTGTTDAKV